jgi:hypothetical protein
MKTILCLSLALALLAGAGLALLCPAQDNNAQNALLKDPAWQPALREIGSIQIGKGGTAQNFCLNRDGNLLVCCAAQADVTASAKVLGEIRVYSPQGKRVKTWPLPTKPQAICVGTDGLIYAAGMGQVFKLNPEGKILASVGTPGSQAKVEVGDEIKAMLKQENRLNNAELTKTQDSLRKRALSVSGIAVSGRDLFVAGPSAKDYTYQVYRYDTELQNPKLVVEKLHGCCDQMDIQVCDGNLWIPHNARHQVECRDREGKLLSKFGAHGMTKPEQFGGCCEPKNLRFLANGELLAAESGPPTCIKRFSKKGEYLGLLGVVRDSNGDCVRMTVEASADAKQYFLLDAPKDTIRIFGAKS